MTLLSMAKLNSATQTLADLRSDYRQQVLSKADVAPDPVLQFQTWFNQALQAEVPDPNAMTLATTTPTGKPAARIVLLKEVDKRGFVFYTNYHSRKGQELTKIPEAALVFWWVELERQVRIEGTVEKVTAAEADAYFQSRPRGSQLGAWASAQSQVIPDRTVLEQQLQQLEIQYQDQPIPRPPHWGGFRLCPQWIEFWQGRPNRLHDRLCYQLTPQGLWQLDRLSP